MTPLSTCQIEHSLPLHRTTLHLASRSPIARTAELGAIKVGSGRGGLPGRSRVDRGHSRDRRVAAVLRGRAALAAAPPGNDSVVAAAAELRGGWHRARGGALVGRSVLRLSPRRHGGDRIGVVAAEDPDRGVDLAGDVEQRGAFADAGRGAAGDGSVLATHRADDPARPPQLVGGGAVHRYVRLLDDRAFTGSRASGITPAISARTTKVSRPTTSVGLNGPSVALGDIGDLQVFR